jgi:hypothetical protein
MMWRPHRSELCSRSYRPRVNSVCRRAGFGDAGIVVRFLNVDEHRLPPVSFTLSEFRKPQSSKSSRKQFQDEPGVRRKMFHRTGLLLQPEHLSCLKA